MSSRIVIGETEHGGLPIIQPAVTMKDFNINTLPLIRFRKVADARQSYFVLEQWFRGSWTEIPCVV